MSVSAPTSLAMLNHMRFLDHCREIREKLAAQQAMLDTLRIDVDMLKHTVSALMERFPA